MDQYSSSSRANDIGAFVETIQDTKDLHLLASLSLRKWVKSLKHGVPNGYEKFQLWLDIKGDSEGNDSTTASQQVALSQPVHQPPVPTQVQSTQQSVSTEPLVAVKPEPIAFTTSVELNCSVPAAMDVPLSFSVPPPDSRKRKVPPSDAFMTPSVNKLSRRANSPVVESDYFNDTSCAVETNVTVTTAVSGSSQQQSVASPPPGSPHSSSSESGSDSSDSDSDSSSGSGSSSSSSGSSSGLSDAEGDNNKATQAVQVASAPARIIWTADQVTFLPSCIFIACMTAYLCTK